MSSIANHSHSWQVWADVFTKQQKLVLNGQEQECQNFILKNYFYPNYNYNTLFLLPPKTGRNSDFTRFEVK